MLKKHSQPQCATLDEVDERQEKNTRRQEHQPPKERILTHFNTCKRSIAQTEPPEWAAIFDGRGTSHLELSLFFDETQVKSMDMCIIELILKVHLFFWWLK